MKKLATGMILGIAIFSSIAWSSSITHTTCSCTKAAQGNGKYIIFEHGQKKGESMLIKLNSETGDTWKYDTTYNRWIKSGD